MNLKKTNELQRLIEGTVDIERIHHRLEELKTKDAKEIIDNFSDEKIYKNVNLRKSQDTYICEFLNFLWSISPESYWKHVKASLNLENGVLWSEDMIFWQKLIDEPIPDDIFERLMTMAIYLADEPKQDLEAIGCVLKEQANTHNREEQIWKTVNKLPDDIKIRAKERITTMLNTPCGYTFY